MKLGMDGRRGGIGDSRQRESESERQQQQQMRREQFGSSGIRCDPSRRRRREQFLGSSCRRPVRGSRGFVFAATGLPPALEENGRQLAPTRQAAHCASPSPARKSQFVQHAK